MMPVERVIEQLLLGARWLLVVFYLGLALGLAAYAVNFIDKVLSICSHALSLTEEQLLLAMLALVDATLVAGLTVMVMIAGYDTFVSRFGQSVGTERLSWLGKLDAGGLKLKIAAAIVAIASISLLEVFLNIEKHAEWEVRWATIIYGAFVVGAVLMGVLERLPAIWKGDPHD